MYRYDDFDSALVARRVAQFRDQTRRFLAGELTEDEFRPLRLQNGLYIQKRAPMLRIAIPYGVLSASQLRTLSHVARRYDRGYGHFTTRQNLQLNWPKLEDVPEILAELAKVEMHAIQTSGNCVRNITSDPLAGVAGDEIVDPRPWSELIRAVVDAESGIRVPAAQVQDRRQRSDARPHRYPRPRHRRAGGAQRGGPHRLPRRRRWRPGPHADDRSRDPRVPAGGRSCSTTSTRSCASTTATAVATTSTRRASRSWSRS